MKKRNLTFTLVILMLAIHLTTAGMVGSQDQTVSGDLDLEKAVSTEVLQSSLEGGGEFEPERSIFSKTTIISLLVAVIGIVAFRRNTYS